MTVLWCAKKLVFSCMFFQGYLGINIQSRHLDHILYSKPRNVCYTVSIVLAHLHDICPVDCEFNVPKTSYLISNWKDLQWLLFYAATQKITWSTALKKRLLSALCFCVVLFSQIPVVYNDQLKHFVLFYGS